MLGLKIKNNFRDVFHFLYSFLVTIYSYMITFLQYVFNENTQITDATILQIADFVVRKIKYILQNNFASENFNTEIRKIWNLYYTLPGITIRFEFNPSKDNSGSYRFENNEHVININLDSLYQGNLDSILQRLSQSLIHELQHINTPGENGNNLKTINDKINFYSNLGEIESHVKQIGWLFYSNYPRVAFSVNSLLKLYNKLIGDPSYADKKSLYKILLYCFPEKTTEYSNSNSEQKEKWIELKRTFVKKITKYVNELIKGS